MTLAYVLDTFRGPRTNNTPSGNNYWVIYTLALTKAAEGTPGNSCRRLQFATKNTSDGRSTSVLKRYYGTCKVWSWFTNMHVYLLSSPLSY